MSANHRYLTHRCPQCQGLRLFRLHERDRRVRMSCVDCATELPASDGPVSDWRELVEGRLVGEPPRDGRRQPT